MTCFGGDLRSQSASILLLLRHIYSTRTYFRIQESKEGTTLYRHVKNRVAMKRPVRLARNELSGREGGAGEREERREGGREKDHRAGMKSRTPNWQSSVRRRRSSYHRTKMIELAASVGMHMSAVFHLHWSRRDRTRRRGRFCTEDRYQLTVAITV